jgi:hypothetical protein
MLSSFLEGRMIIAKEWLHGVPPSGESLFELWDVFDLRRVVKRATLLDPDTEDFRPPFGREQLKVRSQH